MPSATLTIRPAEPSDAAAIAEVNQATWLATYRGLLDDSYLNSRSLDEQMQVWKALLTEPNPSQQYFVALEGNQVVGYCGGGRNADTRSPFQAELFVVYVLPNWHGRGIGKRLVAALAEWIRSKGWQSMQTWLMENNPYRSFYERLEGMLLDQVRDLDFGGTRVSVRSYGWTDIEPLIKL
jgi:GNAT superfamily N-acetyltransferase